MSDQSLRHLDGDEVLDYCEGRLDAEGVGRVELHITECPGCATLTRDAFAFSTLSEYSAAAHGELEDRLAVVRALEQAADQADTPHVRARLMRWGERWAGVAEGAVRVLNEVVGDGARVVASGIDALTRPGGHWFFQPATAAAVRGSGDHDSVLLLTGSDASTGRARITVRAGEAGEITVRLDGTKEDAPLPIVLLTGTSASGRSITRCAEVQMQEGTGYLLARFLAVEPGAYLIALEPVAAEPAG